MAKQFRIQVQRTKGRPQINLAEMTTQLIRVAKAWNAPTPILSTYDKTPLSGAAFAKWVPLNQMPEDALGYHDFLRVPRMFLGFSQLNSIANTDVAFHEMAEALVDPYGTRFITGKSIRTEHPVQYLAEVCDPVEDTLWAFVPPSYYANPYLEPWGYVSWIEDGNWWQAFADGNGQISYEDLGPAAKRDRKEKEKLRAAKGLRG